MEKWSEVINFSDGSSDAWHTNVERRPDGSVMVGFDVGTGGSATTLYLGDGATGAFDKMKNVTADGRPGERPHFAFSDGRDVVTWFRRQGGKPQHIYVRSRQERRLGSGS